MSFAEPGCYARDLSPISDSDDEEFKLEQDDPQSPHWSPDLRAVKRKSKISQAKGSVSGRVKRRKKGATDVTPNSNPKSDSVITSSTCPLYTAVKPPKRSNDVHAIAERPQAPGRPEIWAASRAELLVAFPGLKKVVGGLTYLNFGVYPTLAWLIEGSSWPQDSWDGGTAMNVSTIVAKSEFDVPSTGSKKTVIKVADDPPPTPQHLPLATPQRMPNNTISDEQMIDGHSTLYRQHDNYSLHESMRSTFNTPILESSHPRHWVLDSTASSKWPTVETNRFPVQKQPSHPSNYPTEKCAGSGCFSQLHDSTCGQPLPAEVQVADFSDLRTSDPTKAESPTHSSEDVIPEFTTILHHFNGKMPVVVIIGNDSSILPFRLPDECAFVVLGLFKILDLEIKFLEGELGNVRCKAKLEHLSANGGQHRPWWLPVTPSVRNPVASSPPPVLVESLEGVPERPWWHCTSCGKLSIRKMLTHRCCSHCLKHETAVPAVGIENARLANKCSPDFFPFDDPPRTMKLGEPRTWENRMRVFDYYYEDNGSVAVKHVFTCNFENLQAEATRLFQRVQSDVEMGWQEVESAVAKGPYYSYATPSDCDWEKVPRCIAEARNLITDHAKTYGGEPQLEINHIVAIAWSKVGRKKDSIMPSQRQPVYVLCLGADADFHVERRSRDRDLPSGANPQKFQDKATKATTLKAAKSDRLRVNMVHGDVVIFKGDDFHYSLERTGLTIRACSFQDKGAY